MATKTKWAEKSFYSSTNSLYPGSIGECTWYAMGRAHEAYGVTGLPTGNARTWYNSATSFKRLGPNADPAEGSIACFDDGKRGHVVYIEGVSLGGTDPLITFSEANWYNDSRLSNGEVETPPDGTDGELKQMKMSKFKKRGPGSYLGCIMVRKI